MNRIFCSGLLLIVLCWPALLIGQEPLSLDLAGARKLALEYNKSLMTAELSMTKSSHALREAIANGLPQVNSTVDYTNSLNASISIVFNPEMPATEIPINPTSNLYLNVGQMLFSANYLVGVQLARLGKTVTELQFDKTRLEVLSQTSDAFYLVLVSEELLRRLRLNEENLQSLYEKMEAMEQAGMIEKTELDQLSVQVKTMENTVRSSERQLELARNMLRLVLGVKPGIEIETTQTIDDLLEEASLEASLMKSFDLTANIDYQMMQQQVMISDKMVNMAKADALPTLTGFYRYTYKILKPDFDMTPANVVGLQMNIPIFSSGVRYSKMKQAEIDHQTAQVNRQFLADQLITQERQLRFNYINALEAFKNQKNNVEVARRVYESLKLKYEQGMISGLDLVNADNNYLRAETDYISAVMQVLSTRVQLDKLYGQID
jgi:outer membrane protein